MAIAPNPVGVNQDVQITIWVSPIVPTYWEVFHNFTVTVTKPDDTTEILGPVDSWPHGAMVIIYKPDTVGTYKFKFNYPGQIVYTGDYYLPSETPTTNLVVQQEPIQPLPETPIPTDLWERPISTENTKWASISGNWPMMGYNSTYRMMYGEVAGFNPYTQAPRSAHIMWTKELDFGGLVGGEHGSFAYYSGQTYSPKLSPPVIWQGRLYYRMYPSSAVRQGRMPGVVCVDLRTGEELWRNEDAQIDLIQATWAGSSHGGGTSGTGYEAFLWDKTGSTWEVYDPFYGKLMYTLENAMSGTAYGYAWWEDVVTFDDDGINVYILNGEDNWLAKWSQDLAFTENRFRVSGDSYPKTGDWMLGIEWNVTIPNRQAQDPTNTTVGPVAQSVTGDVLIAKVFDGNQWVKREVAYSLTTGEELWVNEDPVQSWFNTAGEGVYTSFHFGTMRWTGYDANTGTKLWESDQYEYPWGQYTSYPMAIAYGKLYAGSYDGYMHAFDLETGKEVWKAGKRINPEIGVGVWPMFSGPIIGGNVVFSSTGEESPTQPLTKANKMFAFDAETGVELWNINGMMSLRALADGYLVANNGYDGLMYCFGKGPSAMTVEGPKTAVAKGTGVMITGTITDQSAGAKGTPAIADEDMIEWMEYLYMQKPRPEDVEGVEVTLQIQDPNGDWYQATVTADENGMFSHMWAPAVVGEYHVTAMFEGSESYAPSQATTAFGVDPAPEEDIPSAEEIAQTTVNQMPAYPTIPEIPSYLTIDLAILIIAAVGVVIGIVAYMAVRKQQ
jgi:outer membrane protein assembly factor BamB